MYGNTAMFRDEFRELLKLQLKFDETLGSVDTEALAHLTSLAGVNPSLAMSWVQGLARPTPPEERAIIAMCKSISLHTPASVVHSEEQGNQEPQ